MNIPELPIQMVAVTESSKSSANSLQAAELSQMLTMEGSNLADQLSAHFVTSEVHQKKSNFYNSFFRSVCDKKAEIEKAFSLDERLSGRLDDSGEGTLERPERARRNPVPPPRIDSYHIRGPSSLNSRSGSGRSGSGSEIFDRLPDSGLHIGDLGSGSDSDVYSQLDSLDRQKLGGPAVRRVNGDLSRERERHQHSQHSHSGGGRGRRGRGGAPPPPDCSPPPPPRPKLAGKEGRAGQDSPKTRPPPFSRPQPQQSTFGKAPAVGSGSGLYKAESLSLEAVRGNHSSFFPEQQPGKYHWSKADTVSCLLAAGQVKPGPAKVSVSGYEEMRYRQARGSPPEPAPPDPPHHHSQRPGLSKASTMPGPGSHTSLEELTCRNSHKLDVSVTTTRNIQIYFEF